MELTLPGFSLELSRHSIYIRVSKLFEGCLCRSFTGWSAWRVSRFDVGTGFQVMAGPLELHIGRE